MSLFFHCLIALALMVSQGLTLATDMEGIVNLTEDNFEETLKAHPNILVAFFAPWCGHCKNLAPEAVKAAAEVKKQKLDLVLGMVDATVEKKLATTYKITGYPTIKFFQKGVASDYTRGRTVEEFLEWVEETLKGAPKKALDDKNVLVLTSDNFEKTLKAHKHVFVKFYAPWCGYCKKMVPEFIAAADELKSRKADVVLGKVDCTVETELAKKFDISGYPTLKFFTNGVASEYGGGGARSIDMVEWVSGLLSGPSENDEVIVLTSSNFDETLKAHKNILVEFYAPWCGHCKKLAPEYIKAAAQLKEQKIDAVLGKVDCTVQKDLATKFNINGFPTLKFFQKEVPSEYSGGRTADSIVEWIVDALKDPSEKPQDDVLVLTNDNFDKTIKAHKNILVEFYAPWCGYCKKLAPEYIKAAAQLKEQNIDAVLGKVDCTVQKELATKFNIDGFPTLKFFQKEVPSEYSGGRTADSIVEWVESHLKKGGTPSAEEDKDEL